MSIETVTGIIGISFAFLLFSASLFILGLVVKMIKGEF